MEKVSLLIWFDMILILDFFSDIRIFEKKIYIIIFKNLINLPYKNHKQSHVDDI